MHIQKCPVRPQDQIHQRTRTAWRQWVRLSIPSVSFVLTAEKSSPTRHSTLKTTYPTVKKIGTICSPRSACLAAFPSKQEIVGWRPSTTTTTVNALTALSVRRTWRARDFSSRLGNRFAKAMPKWGAERTTTTTTNWKTPIHVAALKTHCWKNIASRQQITLLYTVF